MQILFRALDLTDISFPVLSSLSVGVLTCFWASKVLLLAKAVPPLHLECSVQNADTLPSITFSPSSSSEGRWNKELHNLTESFGKAAGEFSASDISKGIADDRKRRIPHRRRGASPQKTCHCCSPAERLSVFAAHSPPFVFWFIKTVYWIFHVKDQMCL